MKNSIAPLAIAISLAICLPACGSKDSHEHHHAEASDSTKITYTCTMHPEVVSDQPGTCSKCGMELVKVAELKSADEHNHTDSTHHD